MNYPPATEEQMSDLGSGVTVTKLEDGSLQIVLTATAEVNIGSEFVSPLNADEIALMVVERLKFDLDVDWGPVIKNKLVDEA